MIVEKILPDKEYSYSKDFNFDGMDAFTEMSDVQTELVARVFFKVDKPKRHVLGLTAIEIRVVQHHGSYESERLDSHMSFDDLMKMLFSLEWDEEEVSDNLKTNIAVILKEKSLSKIFAFTSNEKYL